MKDSIYTVHYNKENKMKNIITKTALAAILTLGLNPLYAGAGHSHEHGDDHGHSHAKTKINKIKATEIAQIIVKNYAIDGKLEKSWINVTVDSVREQTYKSMPEWVFTFKNPKESNSKHQSLYIFINEYGEMTGANFTGQ